MRITTTSATALLAAALACCLLSPGGTLLPTAKAAQTRRLGRGRSADQNDGHASRLGPSADGLLEDEAANDDQGRRLAPGKGLMKRGRWRGKGKGSCGGKAGKAGKGSNPGGGDDDDDDDDCSETPSMAPSESSAPTIDFDATCVAYAYGKGGSKGGKGGKAGSGKAGKGYETVPPTTRRRLKAGSADTYDSSYETEAEDERRLSASGKGGKGSCRGKAGKAGKGGKAGKAGSGKGKVKWCKILATIYTICMCRFLFCIM